MIIIICNRDSFRAFLVTTIVPVGQQEAFQIKGPFSAEFLFSWRVLWY